MTTERRQMTECQHVYTYLTEHVSLVQGFHDILHIRICTRCSLREVHAREPALDDLALMDPPHTDLGSDLNEEQP